MTKKTNISEMVLATDGKRKLKKRQKEDVALSKVIVVLEGCWIDACTHG